MSFLDFVDIEELELAERRAKQEAENREYLAAQCTEPHPNGSKCMPDWDGYGFVCFDRVVREREEPSGEVGTTQNYRDWVGSAGLS